VGKGIETVVRVSFK